MERKDLVKNLNRLGFPLVEAEEKLDVNKALAEVVKSREPRYWEAFPLLLANAQKEPGFDYKKVTDYLKEPQSKKAFKELLLLSVSWCLDNRLKLNWVKKFYDDLSVSEREKVRLYRGYLSHYATFLVLNFRFDSRRFKDLYENYYKTLSRHTKKLSARDEELSLEYALSQVFSPKQKELFKKKVAGEPLTKTEREYYSRTVKKKVLALANNELHRQSQRLLE